MFVHSSETRAESVHRCLNPGSVFLGHAPFPHHRNAVPRLPGIPHCASWAVCVTDNIQTCYCVTEIRPPSVSVYFYHLSLSFLLSIRLYLTRPLPPLFPERRPSSLPPTRTTRLQTKPSLLWLRVWSGRRSWYCCL